jgi:hypothetical protein
MRALAIVSGRCVNVSAQKATARHVTRSARVLVR